MFRRGQPMERDTNPEHEQKKTQAQSAYQAGDFPKTIELMDAVLKENPRDPVAYYLRGSARVDLGARTYDTKLVRDGVADAREAIRYDTQQTSLYYLPLSLRDEEPGRAGESQRPRPDGRSTRPRLFWDARRSRKTSGPTCFTSVPKPRPGSARTTKPSTTCRKALRLAPSHFGARPRSPTSTSRRAKMPKRWPPSTSLSSCFPKTR